LPERAIVEDCHSFMKRMALVAVEEAERFDHTRRASRSDSSPIARRADPRSEHLLRLLSAVGEAAASDDRVRSSRSLSPARCEDVESAWRL
jgi:hypothetical protein